MNPALLNAPPQLGDIEHVYRDLIYCIHQAFALTEWCAKQDAAMLSSALHDALLEASLLNVRNLDYFLTRPGSGAEISIRHVRRLGFTTTAPRILTPVESRIISQLFAHITANRNVDRLAKKGFPLTRYLSQIVASFDPILGFFEARTADQWEADNIRMSRHHFGEMLKEQKRLDAYVQQKGLHFYFSGSWHKVR
jgi:hypothetical protein